MSLALDDIKSFITISETLNITRASEILAMSQPTLSYSLKRLEKELGTNLIVRLKNGVKLTKLGEEFLKKAKRLVLNWEEAQNIFHQDSSQIQGEFSIGVHPSVAIYTINPLLNKVFKTYPNLNFKLIHGLSREMLNKVINWEIDFAIVINPIEHPDLVIKELGKDIVTLFKSSKSLDKLIYDPALLQSQAIRKKLSKLKLENEGHIHSGNLEVVRSMTENGLGIGLLPTRVTKAARNIKKIPHAPEFKDKICLAYRKEKHQNSISEEIIKIFRSISL